MSREFQLGSKNVTFPIHQTSMSSQIASIPFHSVDLFNERLLVSNEPLPQPVRHTVGKGKDKKDSARRRRNEAKKKRREDRLRGIKP